MASQWEQNSQHLYRIDKFKVPAPARDEFLARVRETQSFLNTLHGCMRDMIFEQSEGPGVFNFVTLVEWESVEAIENAKRSVAMKFQAIGFNPDEFRTRLGIEADIAMYGAAASERSQP